MHMFSQLLDHNHTSSLHVAHSPQPGQCFAIIIHSGSTVSLSEVTKKLLLVMQIDQDEVENQDHVIKQHYQYHVIYMPYTHMQIMRER